MVGAWVWMVLQHHCLLDTNKERKRFRREDTCLSH
jgi:hypothetical protein